MDIAYEEISSPDKPKMNKTMLVGTMVILATGTPFELWRKVSHRLIDNGRTRKV